jgi:hypothetical protein
VLWIGLVSTRIRIHFRIRNPWIWWPKSAKFYSWKNNQHFLCQKLQYTRIYPQASMKGVQALGASSSRILRSLTGDEVYSGVGLSYRHARLHSWRVGTTTLCRSWLYPPVRDLWIRQRTKKRTSIDLYHNQIFKDDVKPHNLSLVSLWYERDRDPDAKFLFPDWEDKLVYGIRLPYIANPIP